MSFRITRPRARRLALVPAAFVTLLAGCGQDGPTGPTTGALVVNVIGLPSGVASAVTVSGPSGFARSVTRTDTLSDLAPGTYTLHVEDLRALGALWRPPATEQQVAVAAGKSPQLVAVSYQLATGIIHVSAAGLPTGATAALTLNGPNGIVKVVAPGDTLREMLPGAYTLTGAVSVSGHHQYSAAAPATLTLVPSLTPGELALQYAVTSAAIAIQTTGLPSGSAVQATVSRAGQPTTLVFAGDTLWGLEPGSYTVAYNSTVANDNQTYAPVTAQMTVNALASETPVLASTAYVVATGSIQLSATGLPVGAKPSVRLTFPNGGYMNGMTVGTINNLPPGAYVITPDVYTSGGITYDPVQATTTTSVTKGAVTPVTIGYTARTTTPAPPPPPATGGINLSIDGMYVTQAVQNYQGTIPLVANRAAMVRVFVKANAANSVMPAVRVRVYNGIALAATYTIAAPTAAVPTAVDQSSMTGSWNVVLPASQVQPGMSVVADVDPTNAIPESSDTDNTFPASGTPAALTVKNTPPVDITFVPVNVTASGLTGALTDVSTMMMSAMAVHPIAGYTTEMHATYTTGAPALDANDQSGGWVKILSEIQALRIADGSSRMYYGLVKVPYTSGVAGYGYVGYPAAIGWDYLPSGAAVLAHEIGHNFGRQHSPCGNPAGPDPQYPFPDGSTGVYGWSERRNAIMLPSATDIMGYCSNQWISEYTYRGVMDFRGYLAGTSSTSAQLGAKAAGMVMGSTAGQSVLVWGRIRGHTITLEPSFQMTTRSALPRAGSAYTLRGLDASGAQLFSMSFDGDAIADTPGADRTFAFAVPLDDAQKAALARIVVTGRDGARAESEVADEGAAPEVTVTRSAAGRATVRWDAARHPVALVRDAETGKVLSFARGGSVTLATRSSDLDVTLGNGKRGPRRMKVKPE